MRPVHHVIISGGVSVVFALWAKSWIAVGACFLSGIFMDIDHHLDYFLARREIPISYKKLVDFCANDRRSKLYLFLHSYELLFLFWICVFYFHLSIVWVGVIVGFTVHIICDEIANPLRPMAYFLTYRIHNRFKRESFYKKGWY